VRYLRSGNIGLVRRALHERTLLQHNAPGIVTDLGFVIPAYAWHERWYYGAGLKLYDLLAGSVGKPSRGLSRDETLALAPTLVPQGLCGGILYHDSQFDDAGLALALALTAANAGAAVVNYARVTSLLKTGPHVSGVIARDMETGREYELRSRVVINAAGVNVDEVRRLDDPAARPMLAPSQGAHLVLPPHFLPGQHALMIPKTSDGRLLFAIPWRGRVLLGTTDTPVTRIDPEPRPLAGEVRFLLEHAAQVLSPAPQLSDVLSMYAGLRPLVASAPDQSTSSLSRDHVIAVSDAGLLTITGGKWTTYRQMAEDAVNRAAKLAGLPTRPCRTATLSLVAGPRTPAVAPDPTRLHPLLPITVGDVRVAARAEMARTVEDVLSRRTRCLILDARAAIEVAPAVARLLAIELCWNGEQERHSCDAFRALAQGYLPGVVPPVARTAFSAAGGLPSGTT
jgi:glycerol-3-phosphate dehydrogenase